jgi:hypothetical protein
VCFSYVLLMLVSSFVCLCVHMWSWRSTREWISQGHFCFHCCSIFEEDVKRMCLSLCHHKLHDSLVA